MYKTSTAVCLASLRQNLDFISIIKIGPFQKIPTSITGHSFFELYATKNKTFAVPISYCELITSNDRSFGCRIIYTETIYNGILFIDNSTILDTTMLIH